MQLKNIFQLLGLCCVPVVIIFGIWYVWFGPSNEVHATFPKDAHGLLTKTPTIITLDESVVVEWAIPIMCETNGIEVHQDGDDERNWMVVTASCNEVGNNFNCQTDLSDKELIQGVTYHLQTHNSLCTNRDQYISMVTSFSL